MARPSNFTPEQILEAAQRLIDEGKKVNGYFLTKVLGGGNPSSIEAKYKELSMVVAQGPKLQSLPKVIEEDINGAVSNLSKTLIETLTRTYGELKADAEVTVNQIKELAQNELEDVRDQLNQAAGNEARLEERVIDLEAELLAANQKIALLLADVSNRDGQIKTLNDAKQVLDQSILNLQGEKQKLEIENASLTKQIADAKNDVAKANVDAEAAIQKAKDDAKAEVLAAQAEVKKERSEKDAALLRVAAAEATAKQIQVVSDKASQDLAEANKKLGQLENQLKNTVTQLDAKTKELETIKTLPPVPAQEAATNKH